MDHDINAKNEKGETRLFIAASKGEIQQVINLCPLKASVNATNEDGYTPLCAAARNGHESIVTILLLQGAKQHHRATDGKNALELACEGQHQQVISTLLNNDFHHIDDINPVTGNTALHIAVQTKNIAIITLLLDNAASALIKNKHNKTALDLAHESENIEIINLFSTYSDNDNSPSRGPK